jgi:hypothetical protein
VYAAPGKPVTVTLPAGIAAALLDGQLGVQIGSHSDDISGKTTWWAGSRPLWLADLRRDRLLWDSLRSPDSQHAQGVVCIPLEIHPCSPLSSCSFFLPSFSPGAGCRMATSSPSGLRRAARR